MSSIRKPKRLTIRGDDEKEYMFLVKGGEDLRMDQRIEQVLALLFICNCYMHIVLHYKYLVQNMQLSNIFLYSCLV